ncbi:integrase core domain-containing protein [Corynebacterium accolens]|jgi:integrase family protein|nr:integrase core domain-containing protein [Corynebacterium accolens]
MESIIGLFNSEEIDHHPRMRTFATWKEVERATDKWVNWYNTKRLYGSIDYVPPIEYEACYYHNHPETDTTEAQAA